MAHPLQEWTASIVDGDMHAASVALGKLAKYPKIHASTEARHNQIAEIVGLLDRGDIASARIKIEQGNFVEKFQSAFLHWADSAEAKFSILRPGMAEESPLEPAVSQGEDVIPEAEASVMCDHLPKDSAWAHDRVLLDFHKVFGLLSPQVQRFVMFISANGSREFTFEDFASNLRLTSAAVRGILMRARKFIEDLHLGVIRPIPGKGYRFEQKACGEHAYQIGEALRVLHPHSRTLAIAVSRRPNIVITNKELEQEQGFEKRQMRLAMTDLRKLIQVAGTELGVLNENKDGTMELVTESDIPLAELVPLTLYESRLWRYIAANSGRILTAEHLASVLNDQLPGKELRADQAGALVRNLRAKIERATILGSMQTSSYYFAEESRMSSAALGELTIHEYLTMKPAVERAGTVMSIKDFFARCIEIRAQHGLSTDEKDIRTSLKALDEKLKSLHCDQFVVERRSGFLQSVQFNPIDPAKPQAPQSFVEQAPKQDPLLQLFNGTPVPSMNDTNRDVLISLFAAGSEGMDAQSLMEASQLKSLRRPAAELNKKVLSLIDKRITSTGGRWRIVDGTRRSAE